MIRPRPSRRAAWPLALVANEPQGAGAPVRRTRLADSLSLHFDPTRLPERSVLRQPGSGTR